MDIYQESVEMHRKLGGKLEMKSKVQIKDKHDLSLAYTPGVAQVCREIAADPEQAYELTLKKNTVAIVSDGSAVLGLGNIGALAAIPVMEGKAILLKEYANVDAFPICLNTQDAQEIIKTVKNIAPVFAAVNLEDISAPRCFEVENALQDIGIPVFHDDQHGTSIVVMAAILNASKLAGKKMEDLRIVINGAGAAGTCIAKLLLCLGHDASVCTSVKDILVCDTKGIIHKDRADIAGSPAKADLAAITNRSGRSGTLADAMVGADVFIGVSAPNCVTKEMVKSMNEKSIVFAMANPVPEIMPEDAKEAGAFIVGTGRSDYPNQVNNVLAFPGIFRGALDVRAKRITNKMKLEAAYALAEATEYVSVEHVLPSPLDRGVAQKVAERVAKAYVEEV
jgi:malate dehydrogenase (oxaloacetate-decarboxylating)